MKNLTIKILNLLGGERVPFIFVIDFDNKIPWICPLSEIDSTEILYDINGRTNVWSKPSNGKNLEFVVKPVDEERYKKAFGG